jgi:hypothetical protein
VFGRNTYYHADVLVQTDEFPPGSYVELRTYQVPYGWSNHPAMLGVGVSYDDYKNTMMTKYNIPDTRPILTDRKAWYLVEGGDKKYYLYCDISDEVWRIEEPSLPKILALLKEGGVDRLPTTRLTSSQQDI